MQRILQLLLLTLIFWTPAWAQETNGVLILEANVAGATVFLNNEPLGKTPLRAEIPAGTHSIRVSARHFDPWVARVQITVGKTTKKSVELFEGGGSVEFIINPVGAEVFIDGKLAGPAPIRLTDLPVGEHRFVLSAPKHEGSAGEFTFIAGANLLLVEDLESSSGRWEVRSTPAGADVFVDDELLGQTPLSTTGISDELHLVRVSKEGFGSVFREVDTSSGIRGELTVNLPKGGASIKVQTKREDAQVRINGSLVGTGKSVTFAVQRGVYQMTVYSEGFKPAETRLKAPRKGSLIYKARWAEDADAGKSILAASKPLTSSWAFWSTVGGLGAGAGVAAAVVIIGNQPEPPPDGDVLVTLP
jgi:hypothetical protein